MELEESTSKSGGIIGITSRGQSLSSHRLEPIARQWALDDGRTSTQEEQEHNMRDSEQEFLGEMGPRERASFLNARVGLGQL